MSLVICSNVQGEYDNDGDNPDEAFATKTGIQNPASFHNHLVNPMKIPPNSEVAVASVKLKRQSVYNITDGDIFYFQLGTALEDVEGNAVKNQKDILSGPQKVRIPPGTYSQSTIKVALTDALKEVLSHPSYFKRVKVYDSYTASDVWNGFTFRFEEFAGNTRATNSAATSLQWQSYHPNTTNHSGGGDWSVAANGTKCEITRIEDNSAGDGNKYDECCVINTNSPMDLGAKVGGDFSGEVIFELYGDYNEKDTAEASFFLTRPPRNNGDAGINHGTLDEGALYNRFQVGKMWSADPDKDKVGQHPNADYIISWSNFYDTAAEERRLFLHQQVWDEDLGGVVLKEVKYWNAGITGVSAQIKASDIGSPGNPGNGWDYPNNSGGSGLFPYFKIQFVGSHIKLEMAKHTKGSGAFSGGLPNAWQTIVDNTNAAHDDGRYTFAPINQNKEALYMGVSQVVPTKKVVIHRVYWNDPSNYNYGTIINSDNTKQELKPSSYSSKVDYDPTPFDLEVLKDIESRENQQMKDITFNHIGKNGTGDSLAMSRALIVNTPNSQTIADGIYYPSPGANMGRYLGFPNMGVISSSQFGSNFEDDGTTADTNPASVYSISSVKAPELKKHSCFIKCSNLTAQSYNFCKSKPSQILYHLPRFDNAGHDSGELFFEVKDRLYVDLKNIDFIQLNELDIQIVNKDERIVGDLCGDTIVTLHFRHKSDRY